MHVDGHSVPRQGRDRPLAGTNHGTPDVHVDHLRRTVTTGTAAPRYGHVARGAPRLGRGRRPRRRVGRRGRCADPRSPQTNVAALASVVVSLAIGVTAGLLTRSRWAMLVAPVVFAVAFEIARMPLDGPTVDAPHLSTYGVLALVVGRGFHALVSLLPMAIGAAWGAFTVAGRHGHLRAGRARSILRWTAMTASAALLVGVTLVVARPASTAADHRR